MKQCPGKELAALDEAVHSFIGFIRSLPPESLRPGGTEPWGPREILIHLVFWHEQYRILAEAAAASQAPQPLKGAIKELNRAAVAGNISASVEELISRWSQAQQALARLGNREGSDRLQFPIRAGSKQWQFQDLLRAASRHIARHRTRLEAAADQPPSQSPPFKRARL